MRRCFFSRCFYKIAAAEDTPYIPSSSPLDRSRSSSEVREGFFPFNLVCVFEIFNCQIPPPLVHWGFIDLHPRTPTHAIVIVMTPSYLFVEFGTKAND